LHKRAIRVCSQNALETRPQKAHIAGMNYVSNIIKAFGGVRPAARAIKRPVSTVQSWKDRGSIPDESKGDVLAAAEALGLGLGRADFFPSDQRQHDPSGAAA
jgi:hypothetical protein